MRLKRTSRSTRSRARSSDTCILPVYFSTNSLSGEPFCRMCTAPLSVERMFLKSWEIPWLSVPTASIFWASRSRSVSRSCSRSRSAMSRVMPVNAAASLPTSLSGIRDSSPMSPPAPKVRTASVSRSRGSVTRRAKRSPPRCRAAGRRASGPGCAATSETSSRRSGLRSSVTLTKPMYESPVASCGSSRYRSIRRGRPAFRSGPGRTRRRPRHPRWLRQPLCAPEAAARPRYPAG